MTAISKQPAPEPVYVPSGIRPRTQAPEQALDLAQFDGHTLAPWKIGAIHKTVGVTIYRDDGAGNNWLRICRNVACGQDALLIAAAPALLSELRALRAERDALREVLRNLLADSDPDSPNAGSQIAARDALRGA